jgi:uncharacterized OB-fold protein
MFRCERCGSAFSPIRVPAGQTCPRCRAREGVSVPLTFTPYTEGDVEVRGVNGGPDQGAADTTGAEEA